MLQSSWEPFIFPDMILILILQPNKTKQGRIIQHSTESLLLIARRENWSWQTSGKPLRFVLLVVLGNCQGPRERDSAESRRERERDSSEIKRERECAEGQEREWQDWIREKERDNDKTEIWKERQFPIVHSYACKRFSDTIAQVFHAIKAH